MHIQCFTTNPFSENSYLIWDDSLQAAIIDPGFYTKDDEVQFTQFLQSNKLELKELILTHAHIDHIFGCEFLFKEFGLRPRMHPKEEIVYQSADQICKMYDLKLFNFPAIGAPLVENTIYRIGDMSFKILFTPGHSPGSISLHDEVNSIIISGDVLFDGSIGRTDLPGGDHNTLIKSIKSQLLILPSHTRVYSGHGGITSIGQEKMSNPFL
ncbi:MAG: MBL fold metallo-hydrolase [Saprospiraceae bacterium]